MLYDSDPDDCPKLKALDKLRKLIAEHELTVNRYQGTIRQFPLTTSLKTEPSSGTLLPPAVSLYSPIDGSLGAATAGGSGVGRAEAQYQCVLEVALYHGDSLTDGELDDLYRRMENYTYLFKRALLANRCDPTPVPAQLWFQLQFMKPVTFIKKIGPILVSMSRFTLHAHERMP